MEGTQQTQNQGAGKQAMIYICGGEEILQGKEALTKKGLPVPFGHEYGINLFMIYGNELKWRIE